MLRQDKRDRGTTPFPQGGGEVRLNFLSGNQAFGLDIHQVLFQDAEATKLRLGKQQLEAPAAGVNGQHPPHRGA
jgi:hypothetical protein